MDFLDRDREVERLERLSGSTDGALAVVYDAERHLRGNASTS